MGVITVAILKKMILQAGQRIEENESFLSELDAAIGDGDHGVSMTRGTHAVAMKIKSTEYADLASLLTDCGKVLMREIGGTCGPLFATLYLKMAAGLSGKTEVGLAEWAAMLSRGLSGIKALGKAEVGDKTMIDALEPAAQAVEAVAADGGNLKDALKAAADAALAGAGKTIALVARKGRGRYQGDTSIGHQDAGATSVALIFQGFHEGFRL